MKKALVVTLLAIFIAAASAWAQLPYTPNADPLLGPHNFNNEGCLSCHAPHNTVLEGRSGYLWALQIPAKTYSTYGGGTIYAGAPSGGNPGITYTKDINNSFSMTNSSASGPAVMHTILCLSCHDTAFSGMALSNPNNAVVDTNGSLQHNHPVDVAYPNVNGAVPEFWNVTVVGGVVSFVDAGGSVFNYGHPAALYAGSGPNSAFVECGSCHNPHNYQDAVVMQGGSKVAVKTAHFVRGQYDTVANQQNFCASCHADKTGQWNGTGLQ